MNHSGVWSQQEADQFHQSSPKLARWLANYLPKDQHVIDFGCGNGFYLNELSKEGFECTGVEGAKLDNFLFNHICIHDLTQPIHLAWRGSVISLEVGEHLPPAAEQTFMDSITNHCTKDLIISWALPNQPGVGHWNCLSQDYVIDQVVKRGFKYLVRATTEARENIDDNTDWFRRTLMVFRKKMIR